jgi:predicted aminopeptidase
VVTASAPYALEPFTWDFPLLGTVSYKGFFDPSKAGRLSEELQQRGFDVYDYEVGAWSTLGWFPDPILSGMLWRDEGRLAELILHELTHATVYLKSNVDLNENLASFVGEQGAIRYLTHTYGPASPQVQNYLARLSDDDRLTRHLVRGAGLLDSLYSSPVFRVSGTLRSKMKKRTIDGIVAALDTVSFDHPERFRRAFSGREWNNAHFLSYLRYDARKDSLKEVMKREYDGDLREMVLDLGRR